MVGTQSRLPMAHLLLLSSRAGAAAVRALGEGHSRPARDLGIPFARPYSSPGAFAWP